MTDAFSFRLIATDGAARRGEIRDAAWRGADAGVHAGRHAGDGEGAYAGDGARHRRRNPARQHLSPDAAARRRADRRARRPAQVHELAAADPHRFRRLPGDVAVGAAQDRREQGRHLPLAYRRRDGRAVAGARHRNPDAARRRHRHAARRVHQAAERRAAELDRAMRLSLAWAERCKRAFESAPPGRALFGIVQGGDDSALRAQSAARAGRDRLSTATPSAAWRSASRRSHARDRRGDRAGAAGRPAALSDGRRHAARICWKRWRAASTCSTACCRPATAATARRSRASARSIWRTRGTADDPRPLDEQSPL